MKRFCKYFGALMLVLLCVCAAPMEVSAAATSGSCGKDMTWAISDGTLTISGSGLMNNYSYGGAPWYASRGSITKITVNSGITSLGDYAFYDLDKVTSVSLPETLTSIGEWAFSGCDGLTQLTFPDSLTSIGGWAFHNCDGLTRVIFPDSLTSIGGYAFRYCDGLTRVILPASLTSGGYGAFSGCPNLTTAGPVGGDYAIQFPWTDTIPDYAFSRAALTEVTLPDTITTLGSSVFYDCINLTEIDLPDSVTSMGARVFSGCTNLTEIDLPDSITSMGGSVFEGCTNLTEITIPASVTSVNWSAFDGCTNLTTVFYGGTRSQWEDISISYGNDPLENAQLCLMYITRQPRDVDADVGTKAVFSIRTAGEDLTYRWQYAKPGSSTWTDSGYSGSKTTKLTIPASAVTLGRNGYQYRCVVTNADGKQLISSPAALYVTNPTAILEQPGDTTVKQGTKAVFSIEAKGKELTYQWQWAKPGSNTWNNTTFSGYNTDTLTIPAASVTLGRNGYQYRCVVKDSDGTKLISDPAVIYVTKAAPPTITAQPADSSAHVGKSAQFTVSVKGTGLTYQWQYLSPGSSKWYNTSFTGNKTATLTIPAASMTLSRSGYQYRCKITDTNNVVVYSQPGVLTVLPKASVTGQTRSVITDPGVTARFSVTAAGTGLTYQWQYLKPGTSKWYNTSFTGNKTATLTIPAASVTLSRDGYQYRCRVTDEVDNVAYSKPATLIVEVYDD